MGSEIRVRLPSSLIRYHEDIWELSSSAGELVTSSNYYKSFCCKS